MSIKQLSIFVENKPGRLCAITKLLEENKIDIRALSIADTRDFGILRLIVSDPEKAVESLKAADCTVSLTSVIAIGINDKPGGLAGAMQILYENNISVEYMYAFISNKTEDTAYVILRVNNNDRAIDALKENGVVILTSDDIYNL
ncbi:MAG: ACT domain-containing protein [Oscillospiraceae bacterium]